MNTSNWLKTLVLGSTLSLAQSVLAADLVTYQLDWLPGGDKAPVYVGIQEGFFKQVGIEVKIASGRGSTDAITKMATGQSDIGSADIGALMAAKAQDSVPVSAVYAYFTQAPHAFFTLADSGINSIKDIAGKKVATSPFTSSNAFLPLVLAENGLAEDAVKLTKADPGALSPMLMTGNADAVIAWVTNTALYEKQATEVGKSVKVLPWSDSGLSLYSSSIVASDKFLKQRPDVAKRFIEALAKSIEFTYAYPERAALDLHKMVPEVDSNVASEQIISITGLVYNAVTETDGFGALTPARLKQTWDYVAKANKLPVDSLDPESVVNTDFLPSK